jgi:DNA-binding NtrC family response regulator
VENSRTKTFRRSPLDESVGRHDVRVEVVAGIDAGKSATLGSRGIVGRAETAEMRLGDPTVSQFHVELVGTANGIRVRDLGSHNNVFLRDAMVRDAVVASGAELHLGETTIRVEITAAREVERSKATSFGELVGVAPVMREMFAVLERVSRTDLALLVEGDAGVGKETVARAVVAASPKPTPIHVVDCGALPRHLAEGALVGDEGALATASGAALLLEEISHLAPEVQSALAHALAGDEKNRPRLLTTSRVDLRRLVNNGELREDLYYALAQARVRVPSLAERRDDIRPMVQHFLAQIPWDVTAARAIDPEALDSIAVQTFPGNVRELRALVGRVARIAEDTTITLADLDFARLLTSERVQTGDAPESDADAPLEAFKEAKRSVVDEFERTYLTKLLARSGTNITRAAALAGVERQSLRSLLKRHGLRVDDRD